MEKTLEEYLLENLKNLVIDHAIRANINAEGAITFYIHPNGVDGDTLDFKVNGNTLQKLTT